MLFCNFSQSQQRNNIKLSLTNIVIFCKFELGDRNAQDGNIIFTEKNTQNFQVNSKNVFSSFSSFS